MPSFLTQPYTHIPLPPPARKQRVVLECIQRKNLKQVELVFALALVPLGFPLIQGPSEVRSGPILLSITQQRINQN